jgi:hypothetical protein
MRSTPLGSGLAPLAAALLCGSWVGSEASEGVASETDDAFVSAGVIQGSDAPLRPGLAY